jgi:hypothetical protein
VIPIADFSPPEPCAARGSGSNILVLPPTIIPSDVSAVEFTGTYYGTNSTHSNAAVCDTDAQIFHPRQSLLDSMLITDSMLDFTGRYVVLTDTFSLYSFSQKYQLNQTSNLMRWSRRTM